MNLLFLTMSKMVTVEHRGIYTDLMRHFRDKGWRVYIVSPSQRRECDTTRLIGDSGVTILKVKTLNLQKTNNIEKGIGQLLIEPTFKRAIKKYFGNISFDLILYSTPPITFPKVIESVKKHNPSAKTYLLLKDIFPQNAVDMNIFSKTGAKGLLYRYFRSKEKKLYNLSDYIGCMSPANVRYIVEHNPDISMSKVEIAPNSVELSEVKKEIEQDILSKYKLPTDRPIFIYGGNLGIPQGIPFIIKCLEANKDRNDCHFLIVGDGTYYHNLKEWFENRHPKAVTLMKGLPKEEYDRLVQACHVGLIFLDYRFTIPNFPSRLLSYLENKIPIISCTDPNCDVGNIAETNGFGFYVPSNSTEAFTHAVDKMLAGNMKVMGEQGYQFLKENYTIENTYNQIVKHFI